MGKICTTINVFRIIRKSQVGEFDPGWLYTLQESGSHELSLSVPGIDARDLTLACEFG